MDSLDYTMDRALPIVSDEGDLSWSECQSLDSDDGHSLILPNSPWMEPLPSASSFSAASSMSMPHDGQLSPISNDLDLGPATAAESGSSCVSANSAASTTPAMVHSASSSSCPDSWSIGCGDLDELTGAGSGDNDIPWEQGSDDILTMPKLEPVDDDDFCMDDFKEAPLAPVLDPTDPTLAQPKLKRPRGRPRKHPLTPIVTSNKIAKGRSKTGCLTCRKRKKKCDEAKPRCMNCEKNAVLCEGYPEKQIWKSGKERAEEERMSTNTQLTITMLPIFRGLETLEDRVFWKHYNEHLSSVLTVEGEHKNAFKDLIVPIAAKHHGLMHSILSLASKHIDYDTPYGMNLLRNNPGVTLEGLQGRSEYHHEKAMEKFYEDIQRPVEKTSPEHKDILSARYGQMLCLLLEAVADGNPRGEHRVHLHAYQSLIQHSPPEDPAFLTFVMEFFQYQIFADELIRLPVPLTPRLASADWAPLSPIHPPRLLGVADGLFNLLCRITTIRNAIRTKISARVEQVVDYECIFEAAKIDAAIKDWNPDWPRGDSRNRVGLLYQQMMWVYLYRTIYPPSPPPPSSTSSLASSAASFSTIQNRSVVNTPPQSAPPSTTPSCAPSPRPRPDPRSNPPSRKNSTSDAPIMAETKEPEARADSPPPIRYPIGYDARVTRAVDESLDLFDSFNPSDPSQTLLLIPCLVVGTACFTPSRQERIRAAVRTVRGYTGLRNTDCVLAVLEEVWRLMELGEWIAVWDWQQVAKNLNLDFLCT